MGASPDQREESSVKHPRRAAAIGTGVAGVLAVSARVVGQVAETSVPRDHGTGAGLSRTPGDRRPVG